MSDATNEPDPTPAGATAPDPAPDPAPEPPAETRTRWRDRAFGFRGVVAVALATLILGGVGGAAIGVVASGDGHDHQGPARLEFRDGDRPTHGGPGMPGFGVPPGTPPQDDVQPDDSDDTTSNS
jgi:hypothetical protein